MKTALIISLAIFLLPLGFLVTNYGSEFLAVDSCLNSGGSYDYDNNRCDRKENHPYIPYSNRKKALILSCASLSVVGLASVFTMKLRNRQRHENKNV